jgi:heme-degrading monooxygenase HmoA
MFSRVVAVNTKEGKARQLAKTIQEQILPILQSQPGFVDEIVLISDTDPDQILALSFWESQQDAERYTHEQYPRINDLISHLRAALRYETFNVDDFPVTTSEAGKAAEVLKPMLTLPYSLDSEGNVRKDRNAPCAIIRGYI